jgi:hypothetical protein
MSFPGNVFSAVGDAIGSELKNSVEDFRNQIGQARSQGQAPLEYLAPERIWTDLESSKVKIAFADGFFDRANYSKLFASSDFSKLFGYYFEIYTVGKNGNYDVVSRLNLPLNPTHIQIDIPPASNVSVTMKGIVEDHNGAPLRRISLRGTSGVAPNEPILEPQSAGQNSVIAQVFKSTFNQAVRIVNQANQVVSTASALLGGSTAEKAQINLPTSALKGRTGYDFIHTMMAFFDSYLSAKRSRSNANMRLAFGMEKDKLVYDVTLGPHRYRKNPGTLEYEYEIELIAWRRRPIGKVPRRRGMTTKAKDLNKMAQAVKLLRDSRRLIATTLGIAASVRADINDSFYTPYREFILLGSDLVAFRTTLADFTKTVINSARASIIQIFKDNKGSASLANMQSSLVDRGIYGDSSSGDSTAQSNGGGPVDALVRSNDTFSKASLTPTDEDAAPINVIFKTPEEYPEIFDELAIDTMQLSAGTRTLIDQEMDRVRAFTSDDLRARRDSIRSFAASVSEALGGGNATYNRIQGLAAPKNSFKHLSVDDVILLSQLNDIIMAMDSFIAAYDDGSTDSTNDYYKFYADYARSNSIAFTDNRSKFYVPFPVGATLESLAAQYLGDSNRWIEIAALNGLKAPYIDEDGFEVMATGSGSGNTISLPNADNLYVGQTVEVLSDTVAPSVRKIRSIDIVSSIEAIITLDGDPNLSQYLTSDNARIKAFKPNTVNSLNMIAIPSESDVTVPATLKITPTPDDLDAITLVALIDLQLSSSGDLVINSSGELGLASGVANIVQAARIKLLTRLGSIVSDPNFGNPLGVGIPVGDIRADQVLSILSGIFKDDERFGDILAGSVAIRGPGAQVQMLVHIQGTSVNLPLVAELPL